MPWPLLPAALAALALLAASAPTVAQTERPAPRPDPLNLQVAVPPFVHTSALASFRRYTEVPVGSWHEANDIVARIGGWRAYTREANQPEAPAAAAPAPAASAPPARPDPQVPATRPGLSGHHGHPTQ